MRAEPPPLTQWLTPEELAALNAGKWNGVECYTAPNTDCVLCGLKTAGQMLILGIRNDHGGDVFVAVDHMFPHESRKYITYVADYEAVIQEARRLLASAALH